MFLKNKSLIFELYVQAIKCTAMKNIIILSVLLLSIVSPLMAQVVVTGHITAEIVDVASISSTGVNELEFSKSDVTETQQDYEPVLLGEFFVYSGTDVAWDVVIKQASLSDCNGECLALETCLEKCNTYTGDTKIDSLHADADQTLQLNGNVNSLREMNSGLYEGSYTIILAYN